MRHIRTIHPISAYLGGPATRSRPAGRTGGASATRATPFEGRRVAECQSYGVPTSETVDSVNASPFAPSPSAPPRRTAERAARPLTGVPVASECPGRAATTSCGDLR